MHILKWLNRMGNFLKEGNRYMYLNRFNLLLFDENGVISANQNTEWA